MFLPKTYHQINPFFKLYCLILINLDVMKMGTVFIVRGLNRICRK